MELWHYGSNGEQHGPVGGDELRAMMASGAVGPATLVWRDGMEQWLPVSQVPELSGQLVSPGSPGYGYSGAPMPQTSGLAIASLICGILGVLGMCMYVGGVIGIGGVVCGHMALGKIRETVHQPVPLGGRGLAIAGLITGYLSVSLQALIIAVVVFAFMAN